MPTLEIIAFNDEDIQELIAKAKAEHPEYLYPFAPEFRTDSNQITAILPCKVNYDYVAPEPAVVEEVAEEVVAEPTTCGAKMLFGRICKRDLPCRYHK